MKKVQGIFVIAALLLFGVAHAKTASEVFDAVSPSIVVIRTFDAKGKNTGLGSGVVIAPDVIATNFHVIENAKIIEVVHLGKKYIGTLRHSDWDRDVCTLSVIRINAPAVKMGSTSHLKIGSQVYAVGAPKGLELTLSEGIISSLRTVEGGRYLQISAPVSPGSSGGGLFDEQARLIGLPTFSLTEGQQLNFAVPVEWISELSKQRKETMKAARIRPFEWFVNAAKYEETKDWAGLLTHSLNWTEAQPQSEWAWLNLAVAYLNVGQTAKAIDACQQSLRIKPKFARAWINLGAAYMNSDQTVKAIEAFQEVLRIKPDEALEAKTLGGLGAAYMNSGQTVRAIETFQEALRIKPEYAEAWYGLGAAYKQYGQTAKVMEVHNRLKALDPEMADRFFNKVVQP